MFGICFEGKPLSYLWDRVCSIFRVLKKSVLPMDSSHEALKVTSVVKTSLTGRNAKLRMTFGVGSSFFLEQV